MVTHLSWPRNWEGGQPTDITRDCSGDFVAVPAIVSGTAKRETRCRFRTRSQPASLLQTSYLPVSVNVDTAYGFVLAGV